MKSLPEQHGPKRENAIIEIVKSGDYVKPQFGRIDYVWKGMKCTIYVMTDALKINTTRGTFRVATCYRTAQSIADLLGISLLTPRISDLRYLNAAQKITPCILSGDKKSLSTMTLTTTMIHHSQLIDQKASANGIISSVGKDWVICKRLGEFKDRGANYGWHDPKGMSRKTTPEGVNLRLWQTTGQAGLPLKERKPLPHNLDHSDYSQTFVGMRFECFVDGKSTDCRKLMMSRDNWGVVSDEGQLPFYRHPDLINENEKSLGIRAVELSIKEMERGAGENPIGSNSGKDVEMYFSGAMRNGKNFPLKKGDWCAAGASWSAFNAKKKGEKIPHDWRLSGIEIEEDAKSNGRWHSIEEVNAKKYEPKKGDLAILKRDGAAWQRHVVRIIFVSDDYFNAIGANEDGQWKIKNREFNNPKLLGFVEY